MSEQVTNTTTMRLSGTGGEEMEVEAWDLNMSIETKLPDIGMIVECGDGTPSGTCSFEIKTIEVGHYEDLCVARWRIWLKHRMLRLADWVRLVAQNYIAPEGSVWVADV